MAIKSAWLFMTGGVVWIVPVVVGADAVVTAADITAGIVGTATVVVRTMINFKGINGMSESSVSVSSPEEDVVISSSSSSRSEPLRPSSSQPPQPSTSQPSPSLPAKNSLGDVKDQAEDEANPKPWYMADEKSSKMSTVDLVELLWEYPLPIGWYARLLSLQEPAKYGTKYETGIYEEQVKSGYRLPLHPFALQFFEHYHMAPGQLAPNGWRKLVGLIYLVQTSGYKPDATDFMKVFFEIFFVKGVANCPGWYNIHRKLPFDREWNPYCKDFENPGKPTPNNLTKHLLSHIKLRGGLSIDEPLSEQQLEWARIIPRMPVPAGDVTPPPAPTISSTFLAESTPLESQRKEEKEAAKCKVAPAPKKTRIVEKVSVEEDPIFHPRWTLHSNDVGMPYNQISEQHLVQGVLPRDKEIFQNQTHETFVCSFAQAMYTMYASGSEMLSRFEMARQVATEEAQQKREALKEVEEATHRAEELNRDFGEKTRKAKRRAAEEVKEARDQGIRDFLDGNAGDEWLKKRADDGLEIYELGFAKAKEMFAEHFPDIPLDDFVLPAAISSSGETVLPSEAGDVAASHPPGEGPSSDAPEP
ncbi:hypothetical protein RJ639_014728 [Escallonia herrerae]|uniref:Transposase (putative) gypsy type domain-containing protein n=1 Tax=Escallonia herrerae TaxID=1293975 RepID=A0AA88VJZ3_9ASTE|nr:hypothetical protein RJ639_014728 [Escallonia herrerae]